MKEYCCKGLPLGVHITRKKQWKVKVYSRNAEPITKYQNTIANKSPKNKWKEKDTVNNEGKRGKGEKKK
jgi:hypothetical protein